MSKIYEAEGYPFKIELRGQELVRLYPTGAEEFATHSELLALQILAKLNQLTAKKFAIAADNPVDSALEAVEEAIAHVDAEQVAKEAELKETKKTRGK